VALATDRGEDSRSIFEVRQKLHAGRSWPWKVRFEGGQATTRFNVEDAAERGRMKLKDKGKTQGELEILSG